MKRFALALLVLMGWLGLIGAAGVQSVAREGWPPQTALFDDTLFTARVVPFLIALGIVAGIFQARAAARGGGDAILGGQVRRHDSGTAIAHWLNAVGVFLCLVTGAMVLGWVERGIELRLVFIIHYVGAALMLFAIFNHLVRHGVAGGTAMIPRKWSVIRDVIGELLEYAGLFGPQGAVLRIPWPKAIRQPIARYVRALLGYNPARVGKYLPTEQLLSYAPWALWITIMVVTGLIKVLRYIYAVPSGVVAAATAIHDLAAIAVGISIIVHLLPLLLVPANWPLLLSIFRTTVPTKYVEERHPAWYRELRARPQMPEVAAGETQPAQGAAQTKPESSSAD